MRVEDTRILFCPYEMPIAKRQVRSLPGRKLVAPFESKSLLGFPGHERLPFLQDHRRKDSFQESL